MDYETKDDLMFYGIVVTCCTAILMLIIAAAVGSARNKDSQDKMNMKMVEWREKFCVEPGFMIPFGTEVVIKKTEQTATVVSSITTNFEEDGQFHCDGCRKHKQYQVKLDNTSIVSFSGLDIEKVDEPSNAKSESVATEKFIVDYEE